MTPNPRKSVEFSNRSETLYYLFYAALTLFLASVPYLYGWITTPPGHIYTGLTLNIDDGAVYLSWMRQVELGHFFQRDQFTTEPQHGVLFNLFFYLLGNIVRLTHLPAIIVYHAARVGCGGLFLWAVIALLRLTVAEGRARRIAFVLIALGSGVGWLWGGYAPERAFNQPVDLWQPEAITFLSLYYTPLFAAALAAMVLFMTSFLRAERSGRLADLVPALLMGFLLGNFHSYDVIQLFVVALCYRVITDTTARKFDRAGWLRLVLIGAAMLPTTVYQYWALRVEPVFYARAFVSNTYSPALQWVLLGFGIPLLLALVFAIMVIRRRENIPFTGADGLRLLLVWATVGIIIAYVPVSFQRKMLMGAQIPLCLLAGGALSGFTSRLSGDFPKIAALFGVLLCVPSNALFLVRDIYRLNENIGSTDFRPYLTVSEVAALDWLRENTKPTDTVLVSPDPTAHKRFPFFALKPYLSVWIPARAGNTVYDGHWSETADYDRKVAATQRFFRIDTPDDFRKTLLEENGIRYIFMATHLGDAPLTDANGTVFYRAVPWSESSHPSFLQPVYGNSDVTIYAVTSR